LGDKETAGFRNAGWTLQDLPPSVRLSVHTLATVDGAAITGFLYSNGQPDIVLCLMHPREFLVTHYLIPELLFNGSAVWTQTSRAVGSDLRLEHEIALLDVAAGTSFLHAQGLTKIVLIGNSGGASLYSLYNEQSLLDPESRLNVTAAGRPTKLSEANMPVACGIAFVAPHPGQGVVLQHCIDPSVVNEADPLSTDPSLNFLDPRNGYRDGAQGSSYEASFVTRFREKQRARVERLDETAHALISARKKLRACVKAGDEFAARAAAAHTPIMTIWRTDADLRCWDLSLDPSDRHVGSVWGRDPFISNFGAVGAGRFCTPEAWLSTWSGITSRANLFRTAPAIEQPCIQIEYSGDNAVFPSDGAKIFSAIRSTLKERHTVPGDHHGRALRQGEAGGRARAGQLIRTWIAEQFL
jgi:hypothetical protein